MADKQIRQTGQRLIVAIASRKVTPASKEDDQTIQRAVVQLRYVVVAPTCANERSVLRSMPNVVEEWSFSSPVSICCWIHQ